MHITHCRYHKDHSLADTNTYFPYTCSIEFERSMLLRTILCIEASNRFYMYITNGKESACRQYLIPIPRIITCDSSDSQTYTDLASL